ncbi:MAG: transporter [Ardenticatenaceae bacterium]|nr:transporter [Ardenticatenaceae bacterium]MCB8988310.1 transporter [Ardenticatenaceae bacterium]
MIELLVEEPLLLLFIVSGVGYALGRIKIKGVRLGVAAILFVGLAVGALDPRLTLPPIIFEMGLIIFVYSIGISSGAGFFASLRGKGLRDNLFAVIMLTLALFMVIGAHYLLHLRATVSAGLFAGSLTNTPALAGVLESIASSAPANAVDVMLTEPVVGYSVAYPMGVMGMILAILVLQKVWKIDYQEEAKGLRGFNLVEQELYNKTILVTQPAATAVTLRELRHQNNWDVVFGRLQRDGEVTLATGEVQLQLGDLISMIGTPDDVDAIIPAIGELTEEHLEMDRSEYDFRRIFVSNPAVAGRSLADLRLPQEYGALVTRVRRGDIDFLAHSSLVLELGDRVRVVSRRKDLSELTELFGDSYRELSEVNLVSLGIGLTLGMLIGLIPIPLPGGITFKLGAAGGPLIVGLVLGALRRTGPIAWVPPYSANLTLRQIGLIFLLAGIGLRSGYTFFTTFAASGGVSLFLAGAIVTCTIAFLTLIIGYKVLKIPFGLLIGMLSALQTQPAVLGFGQEQAENDLPNVGYALIFPVATIVKIFYAQLILTLLS